jgi:multiple antibiotic resistance protein
MRNLEHFPQLFVLFFVIIDPLASLAVFFVGTAGMSERERRRVAVLAIFVATLLCLLFLFFGNALISLFNTGIAEFRVAGGLILAILGVRMTLGAPLRDLKENEGDRGRAVAALIATPLLTGPATITSVILAVNDFGVAVTLLAVASVLALSGVLLYYASAIHRHVSTTATQVLSTILGLVTLSWGISFMVAGLKALLGTGR